MGHVALDKQFQFPFRHRQIRHDDVFASPLPPKDCRVKSSGTHQYHIVGNPLPRYHHISL